MQAYKDYVLVLLFARYVSEKYAGKPCAPSAIPLGPGFINIAVLNARAPSIGVSMNSGLTVQASLLCVNKAT